MKQCLRAVPQSLRRTSLTRWFTCPIACNLDKFALTVKTIFILKTSVLEPNHGEDGFMLHAPVMLSEHTYTVSNAPKVTLESGSRSGRYETGKQLVKSLWSLTCMRQQTHINTHFLMLLQGGPLITANSPRGNKKGCYKWLG